MSECVKYKGKIVTIGTCENLYYTSFSKYQNALQEGHLRHLEGNLNPSEYLNPVYGFMFRFPFPDEDKLRFGEINGDFHRGVPVKIDQSAIPDAGYQGDSYLIYITQQKLVHRGSDNELCLALVFRDQNNEYFRVEENAEMRKIVQQIARHHISNNADSGQKRFYREIATRVLRGYRLNESQQQRKQVSILNPPKAVQKKKGKGLR